MSKHCLIVGGTRGLGRALIPILEHSGHRLSVIGRRPAEEFSGPASVTYRSTDLTDAQRVSPILRDIIETNGPLGSLVFLQRYRGKRDDWEGELATTLTATKTAIDGVSDQFDAGGSIVVVGSVLGRLVADNQPLSYHVAKAGLAQLVRYYAVRLGPMGIRVNGVTPSAFVKPESAEHYRRHGDFYRRVTPLRRMATAEDVANVIEFLCGPKASFITGQEIVVDGGLSLLLQDTFQQH